jgi:hypothetical protein
MFLVNRETLYFSRSTTFYAVSCAFSSNLCTTDPNIGIIILCSVTYSRVIIETASPSVRCLQPFEWATVCSRRKPGGVTSRQPEPGSATSDGHAVAAVPSSRGLQMSPYNQHDLIISPVVPLAEPTSRDVMVPTRIS